MAKRKKKVGFFTRIWVAVAGFFTAIGQWIAKAANAVWVFLKRFWWIPVTAVLVAAIVLMSVFLFKMNRSAPAAVPTVAPIVQASQSPAVQVAQVGNQAPAVQEVVLANPTSCVLDTFAPEKQFGVQLTVDKKPDTFWEFNSQKASRVAGDVTHPELAADASLVECPVVVEGRKVLTQEHHIWILEPGSTLYLDSDGVFRAREFSAWAYPTNWNLDDFSMEKPPIAAEFVDAKVNNMKANNYSWPIFVHTSDGTTRQFKAGDKVGVVLPNNCAITQPSEINVTGIYNPTNKTFDASIGAEGCFTAAKIDGKWTTWRGAKDNVVFTSINAWLIPGTWSQNQVDSWVTKH